MTAQEKFIARFEQLKANGLVDIKFFVKGDVSLTPDEFFSAALRIDQAVEDGKCIRRSTWDDSFGNKSVGLACVARAAAEAKLAEWEACALYDATMEGPVFKGWNRSALDRLRRAALTTQEKTDGR